MDRVRPAALVVAVLLSTGVLSGCGGEDNPISRSDDTDRPLGSSSSSPGPEVSTAPSGGPSTSAAPTVGSPIGAPIGGTTTGVLVQGTGFTVRMPAQPEKTAESAKGSITFDIYRYEDSTATWTVTRGNYPKIGTLPTLHDAITSAAGQTGGKLASSKELKYKHEPAIEGVITGVKLDGKDVTVFARYVVVNRVMYGLLYLDKAASPTITSAFRAFADSLTF